MKHDMNHSPIRAFTHRKFLIITMLATAVAGLLCPVPSARGGVVVLGELARDHKLRPGQTQEATIELENRDASPRTVRIYQSDYRYLANGESFFPAPGSTERSNARWLTFSPKVLTIPPSQKSQVRYLLRAPVDRSKTGTYWSMMMIQEIPDPSTGKAGGQEGTAAPPSAASRYGVQIITQLADTGRIGIEFTSATIESRNSKRMLTIDIENRGSRVARPEMWLEVFTDSGHKAGRFLTDKGTILPGCGVRREIDITSLAKGSYNSLFIADCGKDVYGLEIKLVLDGEAEGKQLRVLRN
jgi:P pilus assembly chaperone PapD